MPHLRNLFLHGLDCHQQFNLFRLALLVFTGNGDLLFLHIRHRLWLFHMTFWFLPVLQYGPGLILPLQHDQLLLD